VFVGLAAQPFVAALLGFVTFPALDYTGRPLYGGRPIDSWDSAMSVAVGAGVVGLFVTIFGALPILTFLLSRGPISREQVFTSGIVLGNVPFAIIVALRVATQISQGTPPTDLSQLTYGPLGLVRALAFGSIIGTGCAGAFWLVAGRHLGPLTTQAG
jgi:hypothetical protein